MSFYRSSINSSDIEDDSIQKEDIKDGDVPKLLAVSQVFTVQVNDTTGERSDERVISTMKNNSVCFLTEHRFVGETPPGTFFHCQVYPNGTDWILRGNIQASVDDVLTCSTVCLSWN